MKPSACCRTILWLVAMLHLAAASASADVQRFVSVPAGPAEAGRPLEVQVAWLNLGSDGIRIDIPQRLPCTLTSESRSEQAWLIPAAQTGKGAVDIAPGGFHRALYRLDLPAGLGGDVAVRIEGSAAVVVSVEKKGRALQAEAPPAPPAPETPAEKPYPRAYFAENLYGHEPLYFLYGAAPKNAKFQLSFKYRILNTAGPAAKRWSALKGLFFGYTQTSFWDLNAASKPFEDTSYRPELFYLQQDLPFAGDAVSRFDFQIGIQHESNGRAGAESRSLNIAYVQPGVTFGDPAGYHLKLYPRVWTYVGDLGDNPDIYRYRGYFDLHVDCGSFDGWKIASTLRKGTEGSNGSFQLDVTYPLNRIFFGNLDFFLHAQLFSGHGESLLHYDRYDTRFRLGLAVYR